MGWATEKCRLQSVHWHVQWEATVGCSFVLIKNTLCQLVADLYSNTICWMLQVCMFSLIGVFTELIFFFRLFVCFIVKGQDDARLQKRLCAASGKILTLMTVQSMTACLTIFTRPGGLSYLMWKAHNTFHLCFSHVICFSHVFFFNVFFFFF